MRYTPFYNHFNMEKHCTMVYFSLRESKQNKKGLSLLRFLSPQTEKESISAQVNMHVLQTGIEKNISKR